MLLRIPKLLLVNECFKWLAHTLSLVHTCDISISIYISISIRRLRVNVSKYQNSRLRRQVIDFFIFCLNKPYVNLFSKIHWKVQQRFIFFKIEGSLKYAISPFNRGRDHHFLAKNDAFSLHSYIKTISLIYICFGDIINHLSTFLKIDIVLKNMYRFYVRVKRKCIIFCPKMVAATAVERRNGVFQTSLDFEEK